MLWPIGPRGRTANRKEDPTRERPASEVDFSPPGKRVVKMPERMARERGYLDSIPVADVPELSGEAIEYWADDHGAQLYFIASSRPTRLATQIESFIARLIARFNNRSREDCPN